jgi:L-fuconolactonase
LRIDSHQHFTPEYSPALLLPILKRNRFDATVMVGGMGLLPFASAEFVKAFVIDADLASPDLPHFLDELQRDPKFRGVCYAFDGDPLPAGLSELARRDLTLDLPARPELVPAIAERFPDLRLVLDHAGSPMNDFDKWARDLEVAAQYELLNAKISGLDHYQPAVRHALRTLGPDRLMFGSDWPRYLPERTWKQSLAAFTQAIGAMPTEIRELLLGATAARFYRIEAGDAQ